MIRPTISDSSRVGYGKCLVTMTDTDKKIDEKKGDDVLKKMLKAKPKPIEQKNKKIIYERKEERGD